MTAQATSTITVSPMTPIARDCSRCDGTQQLQGTAHGVGVYECNTCTVRVGFDLESDPVEFLAHRGRPERYTKNVFGNRLMPTERRL